MSPDPFAPLPASPIDSIPQSPVPSIDLPLLAPDRPAEFIRTHDGRRQLGRVFSQRKSPHVSFNHPTCFYIEFPCSSAHFTEISATKLSSILGDSSATGPFTRNEIARILERALTNIPFPKLLTAATP